MWFLRFLSRLVEDYPRRDTFSPHYRHVDHLNAIQFCLNACIEKSTLMRGKSSSKAHTHLPTPQSFWVVVLRKNTRPSLLKTSILKKRWCDKDGSALSQKLLTYLNALSIFICQILVSFSKINTDAQTAFVISLSKCIFEKPTNFTFMILDHF